MDTEFTYLDCTCESDPIGRCVVHSDESGIEPETPEQIAAAREAAIQRL